MKAKREKITIEPLDPGHAADIQKYASDEAISATTSNIPHPYPADGAEKFVRHILARREQGLDHVFAIRAAGRFVGVCGLAVNLERNEAELGYWIGKPFWGRGYATEGVWLVLHFGFEAMGFGLIRAHCLDRNPASFRVMEKNHFKYLGNARVLVPKWNREEEVRQCELSRNDWLAAAKKS